MAKMSETEKPRGTPLGSAEEKKKALEAARLQIEKQYGAGSLMQLGTHAIAAGVEVIPSGSILLDEALGVGGYPRGRIIEIYGPESGGKTTLALHAIAEAQNLGGIAAFVDAEHALAPEYAKNLGVNIDELWVSQPDTGEQALEIAESLVRSGAVDIIVVDSVAALTPQAEIEGDMGDAHMGLQARLMSQALRKLTATIGKSKTILIFINQIRMKIGVMFGNPETTTGGNALKFYSSVRLEVRRTETIEAGKDSDAVGNRIRVKVAKNKVAPPFRKVELELIFGKGVSAIGSLLDAAVKYEIIDKKGAWYAYKEEKIGQGRDNAKQYLESNPSFAVELEAKLRKLMFPDRTLSPAVSGASGPAAAGPVPGAAAASGSAVTGPAVPGPGAAPIPAAAGPATAGPSAPAPAPAGPEAAQEPPPVQPAAPAQPVPGRFPDLAAAALAPEPRRGPGRPRKNPEASLEISGGSENDLF
ncbi:MAG: recombinase RecA [Spirochaetaceae bacterium]|jgi:recombination protein RecA|nr:recombinase RecA [Spirochaetaceae bacterium]